MTKMGLIPVFVHWQRCSFTFLVCTNSILSPDVEFVVESTDCHGIRCPSQPAMPTEVLGRHPRRVLSCSTNVTRLQSRRIQWCPTQNLKSSVGSLSVPASFLLWRLYDDYTFTSLKTFLAPNLLPPRPYTRYIMRFSREVSFYNISWDFTRSMVCSEVS